MEANIEIKLLVAETLAERIDILSAAVRRGLEIGIPIAAQDLSLREVYGDACFSLGYLRELAQARELDG